MYFTPAREYNERACIFRWNFSREELALEPNCGINGAFCAARVYATYVVMDILAHA